ncbi:MAG: flippase [Desulfobacca sp.]|nr:flippase [Desulfobacca sp.]
MRNTCYNFLGKVLPLGVGLISIPILIQGLGIERYGVLILTWMVIGYFGIFDLGIGRATTKFVAEYLSRNKSAELPSLIWTSLSLLFGLGLVGAVTAYLATPMLVEKFFNISGPLIGETRLAFYLLAFSIPFVVCTAGMSGVLEAQQRFGLINAIRTPASLATYLAPLPVLAFTNSLYPIVALTVGIRLLVWLTFGYFCLSSLPGRIRPSRPHLDDIKRLLGFGGWLTVSNIISPVMVYMDRFLIGALLTMQAVAYYVTPYEIVAKLWIIPQSLVPVLFSAFSAYAIEQKDKLVSLQHRGVKYTFLVLTPITVGVIIFARPFLGLWLGPEFAQVSTPILQLLAVGVLINSIAHIPYSAIQALGRPDLTAKLHLLELPVYLAVLWFAIHTLGLIGVALAWVLRVSLDAGVLFCWVRRLQPEKTGSPRRLKIGLWLPAGLLLGATYFLALTPHNTLKIVFFPVIIAIFTVLAWLYILDNLEKTQFFIIKAKLVRFLLYRGGDLYG